MRAWEREGGRERDGVGEGEREGQLVPLTKGLACMPGYKAHIQPLPTAVIIHHTPYTLYPRPQTQDPTCSFKALSRRSLASSSFRCCSRI